MISNPPNDSGGMVQVIAVVGPTASGKTAFAIEIAERFDTEIISADSMQIYRGMEIGTGAPTPSERAPVPHHFVSFLEPSESFSAGEFQRQGREIVARLNDAGKPAVVVGGSGLYISALIDGLFDGPEKDDAVRAQLEAEAQESGIEPLYRRLESEDPEYAAVIDENDLRRIVRALEVKIISGVPMSELHRQHRARTAPLSNVQVAFSYPRPELYARINARVDEMIEHGFHDEVRALVDRGYGPHLIRLRTLGYREFIAYINGEQTFEEARAAMQQNTRRYAKRQLTWFRAESRIEWITPEEAVAWLDRLSQTRQHVTR